MVPNLLDRIPIGPRLTLDIYDCSRQLAGDRWKVVLEARLEIVLTADLWAAEQPPEPALAEMQAVIGDRQTFVQRRERVFVDSQEKEDLLDQFAAGIKRDLLPYLKHPAFVKRFLEKQYRQTKERRQ